MAGGAGRLRGGRGSPVRVLHHGGWQRTSARPLWQAMIEGKSGVTGSPDPSGAEAEAEAYFGAKAPKPTLAQPDQSSLLLVRANPNPNPNPSPNPSPNPIQVRAHAIMDGKLGVILDQLLGSGFSVGNLQMMQLSRPNAQEFLEVCKGEPEP